MSDVVVWVGSYTSEKDGNGAGISTFRQAADGTLTPDGELDLPAPSWLTWHPTAPVCYAVNELAEGAITTVAPDLTVLDTVPSGGADPCHLSITPSGQHLLCSNYSSGSLAVFGLAPDGRITGRTDLVTHHGSGPDQARQEAAHVHLATAVDTPHGTVVSAVDLGTDEIRSYLLSDAGTLTPLAVSALPPGTGPRQLVRRPGTDLGYVAGELAGTLVTVHEGPVGSFTPVTVAPATAVPHTGGPNYVAHLELAGDTLYVSNRGPDCVTAFDVTGEEPKAVTDHSSGAFPRHFTINGDILYVAAQLDDAIVAVPLSGGAAQRFPTGTPTCVVVRQ